MPPPLTITSHAIAQFAEHVAPLPESEVRELFNRVHREQVLLTAQDPKYPETPFFWGTLNGRDFALAIGPDRAIPGGHYVATTIGLGHLERILRSRRARQQTVRLESSGKPGAGGTNRPFQELAATVREVNVDWPEEGSQSLTWKQAPMPGHSQAWAQIWRWLELLSGVKVVRVEWNPLADPPGWWATLRQGQREPLIFVGSSPMAELYILDQPAHIVPFPDPLIPGRLRIVPLPAGRGHQMGLPEEAREAPLMTVSGHQQRRLPVRALYPGTFDPITKGHLHLLNRACQLFDTVVIAAADNAEKSTVFSLEERLALVQQEVEGAGLTGVEVTSYRELTVDFAVAQGCQVIVRGLRAVSDYEYEVQMAIINRNIAPQVDTVFLMADQDHSFISSSIIKDILMHGGGVDRVAGMVSPAIATELRQRLLGAEAAVMEP